MMPASAFPSRCAPPPPPPPAPPSDSHSLLTSNGNLIAPLCCFSPLLFFSLAQDYWGGTVSHRAEGGELGALGVPLPYGSIGQELTGAGAVFNAAVLSDTYGGSIASVGSLSSALQLHPRLAHGTAGSNVSFEIHPELTQAQWANVSLHIDGPPVQSWLQHDNTRMVGRVVVGVPAGAAAGSTLELVLWVLGIEVEARPSRQVVVVVQPRSLPLKADDDDRLAADE